MQFWDKLCLKTNNEIKKMKETIIFFFFLGKQEFDVY